jgi:Zn-dependent protease with chaperone function
MPNARDADHTGQPTVAGHLRPKRNKGRDATDHLIIVDDIKSARGLVPSEPKLGQIRLVEIIETNGQIMFLRIPLICVDLIAANRAAGIVNDFGFFAHSSYLVTTREIAMRHGDNPVGLGFPGWMICYYNRVEEGGQMRILSAILIVYGLAACDVPTAPTGATPSGAARFDPDQAARNFVQVVQKVEPVAERECRARTPSKNCDFQIVVDDRRNQPPNAFQTVDENGRPILAFTLSLIATVANVDELAFIMGHEAAHHIQGHLQDTQQSAVTGAILFGTLAQLGGGGQQAVEAAAQVGAQLGARRYSKEFELEADSLGTVISKRAGYDPVRGAQYFARIADPGDAFLGTHPPNSQRIETVKRTNAQLR